MYKQLPLDSQAPLVVDKAVFICRAAQSGRWASSTGGGGGSQQFQKRLRAEGRENITLFIKRHSQKCVRYGSDTLYPGSRSKKIPKDRPFMYLVESEVVSEATFGSPGSSFQCLQGQYDPAGLQELNKTKRVNG